MKLIEQGPPRDSVASLGRNDQCDIDGLAFGGRCTQSGRTLSRSSSEDAPGTTVYSGAVIPFAYLDPISGSFLFQALAAVVLGALVYARIVMGKAKQMLGMDAPKDEDDDDDDT